MCVVIALVGPRGMFCDHDGSELKRLLASPHAAGPCPFGLSFFNRSMEIQRNGKLAFFLHFFTSNNNNNNGFQRGKKGDSPYPPGLCVSFKKKPTLSNAAHSMD
jgi:hypothetical protein